MRRTLTILIFLFLSCHLLIAQNEHDALKLSQEEVTGSARYVSLGGAFTSLGADFSGAYLNPAGVAVFRRSEFSISPAFHTNITRSTYYGMESLKGNNNFNFGSLGLVAVRDLRQLGNWKRVALSFGMHRNFSFHRAYSVDGASVPSSLLDSYLNTLNNDGVAWSDLNSDVPAYPYDIFLAWNNFLIDTVPGGNQFYHNGGELPREQQYRLEESGAKRETFINAGANYNDVLFIGGGLIVSRIVYDRQYTYTEMVNLNDTSTVLNEFTYGFEESINGYGISANLGVIYRPVESFRLGMSIKTPTVYSLDLEYESYNSSLYLDTLLLETLSPYKGSYEFRLNSPLRASLGASYIYRKYGLITADIEVVNYQGISMFGQSDGYSFDPEERRIQEYLQPSVNLKVGAEYRITSAFTIRGGYANYANPFKKGDLNTGQFQLYSLGLGWRTDSYFIDGAYQLKTSSQKKYLYDEALVDAADIRSEDHRMTLTVGFRF